MTDLSRFPVTRRWPPANPDVIQLYAFPTPNGVKISIMLEETGLPYEAHRVTLAEEDVKSPEFTSLSPNGKIPAIIDPHGPEGTPVGMFESGAILIHLAEKAGMLLGTSPNQRLEILQWLMWQMGGVGPMFGQLGYFHAFAGKEIEDKRPRDRYLAETRRLLGVFDRRLDGREWVCDDYSIADIAIGPWLNALDRYDAMDLVGWDDYANLDDYLDRFLDRPAVQKGLNTPPRT